MIKRLNICLAMAAVLLSSGCTNDKGKDARLTDSQLVEAFQNPSNEWRGKPFWAWNGKLEKDELLRQVDAMRDMGFGGYFMHSRVGLQTEYLGKEWFELTNAVADYGKQQGMINYLYDEDRWPSGTAGGLVTKNPDYRMNFVTLKIVPRGQYEWADSLLAAFSCQLEGTSFTQLKRLQPNEAPTAGNSVLTFFRERAADTDFVNGFSYVDTMNGEAIQEYIKLTHDQYLKYCGNRIGTSIVGIFTDEPHRGPLFTNFSNNNENRPYMCPWTDKFAEEYKARFHEDIVDQLPYLFLHPDGQTYNKVKWQYCEVAEELFLKNFMKPLYDWCSEHNMAFTGHLLHEDDFVSQVAMQGSLMRSYEYMHIPGIDLLTQDNRKYWIVKQLSSVARQLGKTRMLSELYGATGWQMTFEDYKQVGDWQALYGINLRCPHLSWYTMESEAKRDYPASIFYQSGWYKDFKYVEDYYARLGMLLAQGKPQCDVLVVSPIESVWAQVAVDGFNELRAASPVIAQIENNYFNLFYWLQTQKIDFDYGDEEMMSRLAAVEKNEAGEPILRVGQAAYKTVVVGNMATMRSTTFNLLKTFKEQGGNIVLAGEAPEMIDVDKSDSIAPFFSGTKQVAYEKEAIGKALTETIRPTVSIQDSLGNNIDSIFCQTRVDGDRTLYVMMNMSRKDDYGEVIIHLPSTGKLSEWNCRNGQVYAIDNAAAQNGGLTFKAKFGPIEEHVFMTSAETIAQKNAPSDTKAITVGQLPEEYAYELNEPNVLPLDWTYCTIDGQRSAELVEVLHADRDIRKHYNLKFRGGEMLQPWFAKKYSPAQQNKYGEIELSFPFTVDVLPQDTVYLCIETPERFSISLNGESLTQQPQGWWIDPCYKRIPITQLKEGQNEVTLKATFTEDLNIETLYLTGDFGVSLDQQTLRKTAITTLPKTLRVGDISMQGLPFYTGTVSYRVDSLPKPTATAKDGAHRQLHFGNFEAACIRIRQGEMQETMAFMPYDADITAFDAAKPLWLDVVLTRRNTFGPLHFLPARNWAYYPDLFVVGPGEGFSATYALLPNGLLEQPTLQITE